MCQELETKILQFATMITDPSLKELYYKHFNITVKREGEVVKKRLLVETPINIVHELTKNDFNGADIHWFFAYFKLDVFSNSVNAGWRSACLLISNGTLEDIQDVINKGRIGKTI